MKLRWIIAGISFNVLLAGVVLVFAMPQQSALVKGEVKERQPDDQSSIRLLFVGDIMLGRQVAVINKNNLKYNFAHWKDIQARFPDPDLTIGNLEGPITSHAIKSTKSIQFRFDPKVASQLSEYGFNGFSLANNHTYDQGKAGVKETRSILKNAGLFYFGDEYLEDLAVSMSTQTVQNKKIAFVGFNTTEDRSHNLQRNKARLAIIKNLRTKVDYIIVLVHWGVEYQELKVAKSQQALARALVDAGADVIIGTHPHVVQPLEVYKNKPIFYSLGNFIFDQYWSKPTQEGLVVGITIAQDGAISWTLIPIKSIRSVPQLYSDSKEQSWLARFSRARILSDNMIY